jgi:sulfate adenylyltransferase subunit 2
MTLHRESLCHLDALEAESIHIIREAVAESARPVMLYSIGKDSSVMLRLAQKAFHPGRIPFPLLHIDTGFKFREMIAFRDRACRDLGVDLVVHRNADAIRNGANPFRLTTSECCGLLKTKALLDALAEHRTDLALGGARREEEKSRAKERVFSFRDSLGRWDPKRQRPEFWNLYSCRVEVGQSIRVFPLSNWTELDVWEYIQRENIPVVPLYFAKEREILVRGDKLIPLDHPLNMLQGEKPQRVMCRMRSLGCTYCTGAIRSSASTVAEILDELRICRRSERENRVIDYDQEGSMEMKKMEGYF